MKPSRRTFLAGTGAAFAAMFIPRSQVSAAEPTDVALDGPWVNPPNDGERVEGVVHRTFRSTAMGRDVGYNLYLPPPYAAEPLRRFPVVYHLHGRTDSESTHLYNLRLLVEAVRAGAVPPCICVYAYAGRLSFFTDWKNGPVKSETVVLELVRHIDANFRTKAEREHRGLIGWSMGGWGALKLAFRHPELFSAAASLSGGFLTIQEMREIAGGTYENTFGSDPDYCAANSPLTLAVSRAPLVRDRLRLSLAVGDEDFLIEPNRRMHRWLDDLKLAHDYRELPGLGHDPRQVHEAAAVPAFKFLAAAPGATK
jgi:endo-1,4-beta-xylanase